MNGPGFVPLSPISFLKRAGEIFADKSAVVTPKRMCETYGQISAASDKLADRLRAEKVGRRGKVAVLARNGGEALSMNFAVPGVGAALVALNTRLASEEYLYILDNCAADLLFVEAALLHRLDPVRRDIPCEIIELPDAATGRYSGREEIRYCEWLEASPPVGRGMELPTQETDALAINYTSGTTGRPKGAIYTHRGAYLNALGVALELEFSSRMKYLWTLPMFHCNGWSCAWAVTAVGGTHVMMADFDAVTALALTEQHGVTHLCGAPVVANDIARAGADLGKAFGGSVTLATGGAPPSPSTISKMRDVGIKVVHLYGLTETYGPSVICEYQPSWDDLSEAETAKMSSRQGVRTINVEQVRVVNDDMNDVVSDGQTLGEVIIKSNTVISKYLNSPEAHSTSFLDDWLRTGDLAVRHPDGYIEVRDRRKDIIISGGENISSVEVEYALAEHPDVVEAAVVAMPHNRWGEVPVAVVALRAGGSASEAELIAFVRARLAHFKAPKAVFFRELPRTSTGKIQKYLLRRDILESGGRT